MDESEEARLAKVHAKAESLGIPIRIDGPGSRVATIYDFRGDQPLYRTTLNANAAISSGANLIQAAPYSLTGNGTKVGVWDAGKVRSTHQELTGRVTYKDAGTTQDDHSTHVGGTIGASGVQPAAKGMAPQVRIDSYDWTNDYTEMTAAGAATSGDTTKLPLSNHSYGYGAVANDMGRYETEARSTDAVGYSLPYYLICWAAGNEQDTLTTLGGYQSITFNALAKNILTVGAANDAVNGGVRAPGNGTITYFSSLGPCDDGRIKPDLVANGMELYSCNATSNTSYEVMSGTSMATPSAAGSSALLSQLYAREFNGQMIRASTLKGLLIHTADDLGNPGPDYTYGWGLINVKAAADVILAHKASLASPKIIENTVTNSAKTRTHTFTWDGTSPIRATLCWTDPAGVAQTGVHSRTPNIVNNLDLQITGPTGTTFNPYVMPFVGTWTQASMNATATTGKNNVDTVEQVYISKPTAPGNYTVTVSVTGNITNTTQNYSLIVTGGVGVAANPPPSVSITSPATGATTLVNQPVTLSANASDTVIGGGPGIVSQVEFFANSTSLGIVTSAPYTLNWNPQTPGTYAITATATDSEGATSTSTGSTVYVLSGDGTPSITSFTPTSARPGNSVVITGQNFAGATNVTFNGTAAASFTVDSLTQITATVPNLATSGPLAVVTPRGNATSSTNFAIPLVPVLISQIYGAGGNSGAVFNSDYVELYNRSSSAVSLAGWSVQYASAAGTSWATANLTGSIQPGKYYLVKLAGGTTGAALPTADATGSINMSGTSGKVALCNSNTALTGSAPLTDASLQDFVGYGNANAYEGSAAAPSPSATTAIFRAGGGATDTGDNSADFTAASPNPRNSAGSVSAPVITSSLVAGGTVGSAFSYQITASNTPTSFGATGLPGGLSVNATSGLISGTPSIAGTSNVTLSATNSAGTGNATLALTIVPGGGGGNTTLLSEDFSSITLGSSTTTSGSSSSWNGTTNFPIVSTAFQAGGAVRIGSGSAVGSITSRALDLSGNGGSFTVSFKVKGWTTVEGNIYVVSGTQNQTVTYTQTMNGTFETKSLAFSGGTSNATITIGTTSRRAFIDDVVVTTASAGVPTISTNGTVGDLTTTYGSATASPATFTLSGTNMLSGISLTAPAGFEISQTAGGTSGYASSLNVGSSGSIAPTTIYVRLAASTDAGSYSGSIVCTSPSALPVVVTVPSSDVRPRPLAITANNRSKVFGNVLSLGTSEFTSSGLVGSQTIGAVTLSASGGTAAGDIPGNYSITPSAATGGNFTASNYDIGYYSGTLTVTAPTFAEWIATGNLTGPSAAPEADPDADGLSNLLEYFMGLNPALADSLNAQQVTLSGSELRLTYRRSKGLSGVSGAAEWSTTLSGGSWSTAGITDTSIQDNGLYETRRATIPLGTDSKKFLRLRVTTP